MHRIALFAGIFATLALPCHADGGGQSVVKCVDKQGHVSFARTCAFGEQSQAVAASGGNFYDHADSQRAYDNTPAWQPPTPARVQYQAPEPDPGATVAAPPGPDHSGCGSVIHRSDPNFNCAR